MGGLVSFLAAADGGNEDLVEVGKLDKVFGGVDSLLVEVVVVLDGENDGVETLQLLDVLVGD